MISKRELESAINECESGSADYNTCQQLATFYEIQDHLYGQQREVEKTEEDIIGAYGESEFLETVSGMKAVNVWMVMDELMATLQAVNPRLYNGVMRKLTE